MPAMDTSPRLFISLIKTHCTLRRNLGDDLWALSKLDEEQIRLDIAIRSFTFVLYKRLPNFCPKSILLRVRAFLL